jgi:hypothetical protein
MGGVLNLRNMENRLDNVGEAWAEFIGTDHARRYHPNGLKCSEFYRQTTGNCLARFDTALEGEKWFDRDFIGTGVFHDLRDTFNAGEPWDLVQGVTIRQMYNALTPNANTFCRYLDVLIAQNPGLNINNLWLLLERNADSQNFCNI